MHVSEIGELENKMQTFREWMREGKTVTLHNFGGKKEEYTRVATWVRNADCRELVRQAGKEVKFKAFLIVSDKRQKSVPNKSDNITMVYLIASKTEIYVTASGVFADALLSEIEADPSYATDKVQTIIPIEKRMSNGNKCLILSTELPKGLFE